MALSACGGTVQNGNDQATSQDASAAPTTSTSVSNAACTPPGNPVVPGVPPVGPDDFNATGEVHTTPSCLAYIDLAAGTGAAARAGQNITVQYTGWLSTGKKFDSSRDRGQPFTVQPLGAGRVIAGWDEGLVGMKVGGRRKLIIPSQLGYGPQGSAPVIPGGATLVFIVEVLAIQ